VFSASALVVIALFAWRAGIQTSYWQNTERLWNRTLALTKQNDIAHFDMGEFLLKAHRFDEAISQFQTLLANQPDNPNAHFPLGSAYMEKGQLGSAFLEFERALQLEPGDPEAEANFANVVLKA